MAKQLTQFQIDNLKSADKDYEVSDGQSGLRILVRASGNHAWVTRTRCDGQLIKITLGRVGAISLKDARKLASKARLKAGDGINPAEEKRKAKREAEKDARETFEAVARNYLKREGGKLRTAWQCERVLVKQIFPAVGAMCIDDIRKKDVTRMLDAVEDDSGKRSADVCLAYFQIVCNWHASRTDFQPLITRGMHRNKDAKPRGRKLSDDEIARVWKACDQLGTYGKLVQFLILSGCRFSEAAELRWDEIQGSTWELPASRDKVKSGWKHPLSEDALAIINNQPRIANCPYVFSLTGARPVGNHTLPKRRLDGLSGVTGYVLHNLRKTARTLMSRAGVIDEVAERAIGHLPPKIERKYNDHDYFDELRDAFEKLAKLVGKIVDPPPQDNVVALARR
jgi:integrase